jgi:hypothetical protein
MSCDGYRSANEYTVSTVFLRTKYVRFYSRFMHDLIPHRMSLAASSRYLGDLWVKCPNGKMALVEDAANKTSVCSRWKL